MRVGATLLVALVVALARTARADQPQARLAVVRADSASDCPDTKQLIERVNAATQRSAVSENEADAKLDLKVALSREGELYRAEIRAGGSLEGVREIEETGDSCAGLAAAVTVSISLLLDEARKAEQARAETRAMPAPPIEPSRSAPQPVEAAPQHAPSKPLAIGGGIGGALTIGLTRPFSPGLIAQADVGFDPWSIGAGFLWLPDRDVSVPQGEVQIGLWAALVRGCYRALDAPRLLLCVVPAAGALSGEASGLVDSRSARRPWLALGASVRLEAPIVDSFGWGAEVAALAPLNHETFSIGGVGTVHDPSPVGGWLALSVRWSNF